MSFAHISVGFYKVLIEQFATHSIMFCLFNAANEDYFFKNGLRFKKLYLREGVCKKKTGTLFWFTTETLACPCQE